MTHLWEVDHPYYGSDSNTNRCDSFAELRADVERLGAGQNHIYRWDWIDWSRPEHDSNFVAGEDRSGQDFTVFLVLPRKSMLICFTCPVTHADEPAVLEWLRGPRVLGALRELWSPLLDEVAA